MTLAKQETNKHKAQNKKQTPSKQTNKTPTQTTSGKCHWMVRQVVKKKNIHHYLYIHKEKDSYIKIIHLNKVHFAFVITFSNASV